MSNLFYLPRVHSQPGAKLYFRQTGTSTPQNTYTDADLSVAHSNPVVADAEGYFDPIYLDPSLPNYRVIHTDGSNVDNDPTLETELEPTLDDVPSSSNISSAYRVKGTAPSIIFEETDQSVGNKKWRMQANGNSLVLAPLNDAESAATAGLSIDRNGVVSTIGGVVTGSVSGSFTAALTGMDATTEGTIFYTRDGSVVTLYRSPLSGALTGTSNSTAMTLTGIPAAIRPKAETLTLCYGLLDNTSVLVAGVASISTSGVATFQILDNPPTTFTASGGKGLNPGWSMVYVL